MKTVNRILFWLALTLFLTSWTRLGWKAVANPSPGQLFEFHSEKHQTQISSSQHLCYGPALIDGASFWQWCLFGSKNKNSYHRLVSLVRFDMETRRADANWPFRMSVDPITIGAVRKPHGELILLLKDGLLLEVKPEGGLVKLGQTSDQPIAFDLVEGRVEVVNQDGLVASYSPQGKQYVGQAPAPEPMPGSVARLALAEFSADTWRFTWIRAPADTTQVYPVRASLLCSDIDNVPQPCGTLEGDRARFRSVEGRLEPYMPFLDRSGENLLKGKCCIAPLLRQGEGFAPLPPPSGARFVRWMSRSDGLLTSEGLVPLPVVHSRQGPAAQDPIIMWVRFPDGWIGIWDSMEGVLVSMPGKPPIGPLSPDGLYVFQRILQIPDSGFLLVGEEGIVVRLDTRLRRVDALGLIERVVHLWTDFDLRSRLGFGMFYQELVWIKRLSLPLVLLLWPLLAALLYIPLLRFTISPSDSRTHLCFRVAAWIYIPTASALFSLFWQMTERL